MSDSDCWTCGRAELQDSSLQFLRTQKKATAVCRHACSCFLCIPKTDTRARTGCRNYNLINFQPYIAEPTCNKIDHGPWSAVPTGIKFGLYRIVYALSTSIYLLNCQTGPIRTTIDQRRMPVIRLEGQNWDVTWVYMVYLQFRCSISSGIGRSKNPSCCCEKA